MINIRIIDMVAWYEETRKWLGTPADKMQWKNRNADGPISAKKPKKVKDRQKAERKARKDDQSASDEQETNEESSE